MGGVDVCVCERERENGQSLLYNKQTDRQTESVCVNLFRSVLAHFVRKKEFNGVGSERHRQTDRQTGTKTEKHETGRQTKRGGIGGQRGGEGDRKGSRQAHIIIRHVRVWPRRKLCCC